jgi:hypothetical protein
METREKSSRKKPAPCLNMTIRELFHGYTEEELKQEFPEQLFTRCMELIKCFASCGEVEGMTMGENPDLRILNERSEEMARYRRTRRKSYQ